MVFQMIQASEGTPKVLVVEDEEALLQVIGRILRGKGFQVELTASAELALALLPKISVDAVLTDISMPGMDGVGLLKAIRAQDLDVPVILMTGNPTVYSAAQAVDYGALRYLVKPVASEELVSAVGQACKLGQVARLKRETARQMHALGAQAGDRAGLEARFEKALEGLYMAFQPIVNAQTKETSAYEALVRSTEPSMSMPNALFDSAERLGKQTLLSQTIRNSVALTLQTHKTAKQIFVNLLSSDLQDDTLYSQQSALFTHAPRLVFEITERIAIGSPADTRKSSLSLKELGYKLAIDDLGAGYAGLSYFAILTPDIVKLDMSLVHEIDKEPIKQKLVASMVTLCHDLDMRVVAEGIERKEELAIVCELGCDLLQGFLLGKPGPAFTEAVWP